MPAVVTAGGRIDGEFAREAGTDLKALVPVGGRPVLAHVIDALRGSGNVSHVFVVGPKARLEAAVVGTLADDVLEEGETGPENFRRGLSRCVEARGGGDGPALLCATDLAFLDAPTVRWLADKAPAEADIVFPIVEEPTYLAAFPGSPNAFAPLVDGRLTGGSLQIVRPRVILENMHLIEAGFAARKSQIAMARLLGPGLVLRFLLKRLTVAAAAARVEQVIGCRVHALLVGPEAPGFAGPRLCADIDGPEDYAYVRRRWAEMYPDMGARPTTP